VVDRHDPEMLKTIATAVTAIVGGITALTGALAAATKSGRELLMRGWTAIRGPRRSRTDLRIIASDRLTHCSTANVGDEQISGTLGMHSRRTPARRGSDSRISRSEAKIHFLWVAFPKNEGAL
jgi:hypothetical protein